MSPILAEPGAGQVEAGLDTLAATDVIALADAELAGQMRQLVVIADRVQAELVRRVEVFDRRGLAAGDGFRSAKAWLQAACRVTGVVAHRLVKAGRLLRRLPKLAEVFQAGEVPAETVQQVVRLADQVGAERVAEIEPTLADAAAQLDSAGFAVVCERVRAHLLPDGAEPAERFARRAFTLSPVGGMVAVGGQLDPEGGAALATALDAVMGPPGEGDERSAAQRRADALVELARRPLTAGELPSVGGQRPQVGVLLYPQALSAETLAQLAQMQQDGFAAARLRQFLPDTDADTDAEAEVETEAGMPADAYDVPKEVFGRTAEAMRADLPGSETAATDTAGSGTVEPVTVEAEVAASDSVGADSGGAESGGADSGGADGAQAPVLRGGAAGLGAEPDTAEQSRRLRPVWSRPGWADPPHLNWFGPIPVEAAQRIACDADFFRVILDPASGMPLDVGRSHRLVPYWIRRALWARDRGCRWTGCATPVEWSDAHHLDRWVDQGETKVERLVLLCRHHHGLVHEGGWGIELDPHTGEVTITRPGGGPYALAPNVLTPNTLTPNILSRSSPSWNGPTTQAT